jgi:hypothetical protein
MCCRQDVQLHKADVIDTDNTNQIQSYQKVTRQHPLI